MHLEGENSGIASLPLVFHSTARMYFNTKSEHMNIIFGDANIWMPKCVKTIPVDIIHLFEINFDVAALSMWVGRGCGAVWGPFLALRCDYCWSCKNGGVHTTLWLNPCVVYHFMYYLTFTSFQYSASCSPVCVLPLSSLCTTKISLTEIQDMKVRMNDSSWMMFSFDIGWKATVLHPKGLIIAHLLPSLAWGSSTWLMEHVAHI